MEVSYNNAERLVRTELNYVQNKAALDSLKSAELEHYRFVAALDNRTCPRCGGIDGRVFEVQESMPGETFRRFILVADVPLFLHSVNIPKDVQVAKKYRQI